MEINTVLFDLDGTLINTNDLILASFEYTLNHFLPNETKSFDIIPYIGEPLIESFKRLDEKRADEMLKMYRKHNDIHHDLLIKEYDGVYETVKQLKELGIKLAVVTNKLHDAAVRGLEVTRLAPYFDVVVGFDDVNHGKPHAEPIIKALEHLDSKPETAIMVGDSQYDIEAGKRAGTYTAGVAWSLKGKEFILKLQPDYVVEHMSDLINIVGVKER